MNEFDQNNCTLTEFQTYYYTNSTEAREWLWKTTDTAFGDADAETLEVVDDCEKNWLINYLIGRGFQPTDIHETPNMSHVDVVAYSSLKNTLYVFECKERDCDSQQYRSKKTGKNTTLLDDEKTSYISEGIENFNDLVSEIDPNMKVVANVVYFYRDGNVYFFRHTDFNANDDRYIWTQRTHKKKTGSRKMVKLLCHFYDLDKPRLMVHDEIVRTFYY